METSRAPLDPEARTSGHVRRTSLALALVGGACLVLSQSGCASPAQSIGMVPDPTAAVARSPATVSIDTSGGRVTSPLGRSQISNAAFTEAVGSALAAAGLLHPVVDRAGDYHLDIHIAEVEQPHFAFPMTVHLVTTWRATPRGAEEPIWTDVIATTYTVPFEEEFFGIRRLRLATEGAGRENIRQAVAGLAKHVP